MNLKQTRAVYAALVDEVKWDDAVAILQDEMGQMAKKITPEALRADGWEEATGVPGLFFSRPFVVYIGIRDGVVENIHRGSVDFEGVATMHDLRELVRLLGGAK